MSNTATTIGQFKIVNKEVPSEFWDKEILISEIPVRRYSVLRVSKCTNSKGDFLSMRVFVMRDGEFVATRQGLNVAISENVDIHDQLSQSLGVVFGTSAGTLSSSDDSTDHQEVDSSAVSF